MIRVMREKGTSISAIARELHISKNVVKRHLKLVKPLKYNRRKRKSKLDPVKLIIKMLIDKYNRQVVRIQEGARKWGYDGSYSPLKGYCRSLRKGRSMKAVYRFETDPVKQARLILAVSGT